MTGANIPKLIELLRTRAGEEKRLPCAEAFKIAAALEGAIAQVGKACDELQIKIVGCQLGCF
jgi:molybdate transport system regulatory protein